MVVILNGKTMEEQIEDHYESCYVTPVPGGVGLLTRVTLLKNVMNSHAMTN